MTTDEITFRVKQNDLEPSLLVQLLDDETPLTNLAGASSVRCVITTRDKSTEIADRTMEVVDADNGWVEMTLQAGDTATVGYFIFEIEVTWPNARPQTFPVNGYGRFVVTDDLG